MRKLTLLLIVVCLGGTFIFFYSCKKDTAPHLSSNDATTAKVNSWLDEQEKGKHQNRIANMELLKANLEFSSARFEKSGNDEQLLIIPVNDNFKTTTELDKGDGVNLVLFINASGNIRSGNIVLFTPANGRSNKVPANTFHDIFNTAQPESDGKFQFLAVSGMPQYVLEYKDKHLISSGAFESKQNGSGSARTSVLCYDWYLVTTWYDIAGNVTMQTRMFLYSSCDGCASKKVMTFCPDNGLGGNSSTSCCITDPTAVLTTRAISQTNSDICGFEAKDRLTGILTKTCTHTWYFVSTSILWYTWQYGSTELATEQKPGTVWNFKSVSHQTIFLNGTVPPCVNSQCVITIATPSFLGNTARMDVSYTLTLSYPCVPSGGGSQTKFDHGSTQWIAQ